MKILFSGGGTLGPVTPLLAMHEMIRDASREATFVWVGTKGGPEKALVEKAGIPFHTISSGKFRRYLSWWNVIDIAHILIGFFQSLGYLAKERPTVCISAGGFISVPLHYAAWMLGIPTWIHQQDVHVGLANKLMAPVATLITTALEKNLNDFSKKKTFWLGNPIRQEIVLGEKERARKRFHIPSGLPVVFATGGGTGSLRVNQLVAEAVQYLKGECYIIHLSGKERPQELVQRTSELFSHYQVHQFFTHEMTDAYAAADLVISRGGFGTITEIAALGKPAILIPKPGHQEENVQFLASAGAVLVLSEVTSDGRHLAELVKDVLHDPERIQAMSQVIQRLLPAATPEAVIGFLQRITHTTHL
ncbi:MAG TPA: UDP-N-acetylglucosamine--N-acetylmuramyl-(pentapeptide) pyrophosphoryl-undecaprenol N-acetylglucosamine transferase [Candidatus Kapabacteria bacterium]|nr:UDP-N-acetylglucosamine--N-acetylmuramyl-(pentapeptide) pyrophosphoryl-undecaprenol N-acetylglucosamine transferase [Candidatus Kapabacteria bacterium]